jgi:Flp pilus assembly protein TadG
MIRFHLVRLATDRRGAAIIELALVSPVLALTIIGIVDISNAYSHKLALEQGAQRSVELIMQSTKDDTVEGSLKNEVVCQVNGVNGDGTCKTSPITASNVTVTFRLECKDSSGTIASQTSTDAIAFDALTCASNNTEARYIEVSVTNKYVPMFPVHFAGFDSSDGGYRVSAKAGMRTQ